MAWVLVQGGVVIQKQPDQSAGFISAPDSVLCGYLYNGQTFTAPTAPAPVPEQISPRQFRQSLNYYGFRANVDSAVTASTDQNLKDWYQYATVFERHHPQVLAMATQLGYTSAQLDAVWTYGASI